jgi:hypothetical protein
VYLLERNFAPHSCVGPVSIQGKYGLLATSVHRFVIGQVIAGVWGRLQKNFRIIGEVLTGPTTHECGAKFLSKRYTSTTVYRVCVSFIRSPYKLFGQAKRETTPS